MFGARRIYSCSGVALLLPHGLGMELLDPKGNYSFETPSDEVTDWKVLQQLFTQSNYDPLEPPFIPGEPLKVAVAVKLIKVTLDLVKNKTQLTMWLRLRWNDHRLRFDGKHVFGKKWRTQSDFISTMVRNFDDRILWTPDIDSPDIVSVPETMYADKPAYIYDVRNKYNIFWSRPATLVTRCDTTLKHFPFDVQRCKISFESWMYDGRLMDVVPWNPPVDSRSAEGDVEYDLEFEHTAAATKSQSSYDVGVWPSLGFNLVLKRKTGTYVIVIMAPCAALVFLSTLVFWLPIDPDHVGSGERVSYAVTLLLSTLATVFFTADRRPVTNKEMWLDRYQFRCINLVTLPLIQTIMIFFLSNTVRDAEQFVSDAKSIPAGTTVLARNAAWERWKRGVVQSADQFPPVVLIEGEEVPRSFVLIKQSLPMADDGVCSWSDEPDDSHAKYRRSAFFQTKVLYWVFRHMPNPWELCIRRRVHYAAIIPSAHVRSMDAFCRLLHPLFVAYYLGDLYLEIRNMEGREGGDILGYNVFYQNSKRHTESAVLPTCMIVATIISSIMLLKCIIWPFIVACCSWRSGYMDEEDSPQPPETLKYSQENECTPSDASFPTCDSDGDVALSGKTVL